jgi:hypothetical protein
VSSAKEIRVAAISSTRARAFIREHHYSGKVTSNSQLHLGVFLGDRLLGAMQFGPPLDRSRVLGLVSGTEWSGMLELNRLAFLDDLPRNSESRALGVVFRMLRKTRPDIEWVLSFADGTQCGDGAIYRASGFELTGIRENTEIIATPNGAQHILSLKTQGTKPIPWLDGRTFLDVTDGAVSSAKFLARTGIKPLAGFQLRYIRFLNPAARARLTVPVLPFSAIDDAGARMYRGVRPPDGPGGVQPPDGG